MPLLQTNTDIATFADAVEYLLDFHEIDRTGLNQRRARAAILRAYRDLPNHHSWNYYYRQRILQTVASYSTGTIAYDHTGGASERLVTLTSGTWPSWAAFGRIIIDSVHYEVDTRESDSAITLRSDSNPGADVAASTTYTLYRNTYPLPADFGSPISFWDVGQNQRLQVLDQERYHHTAYLDATPSTPLWATLSGARDHYATMQLIFGPPPNDIYSYDLLYRATPRPLNIDSYSTGTVAVTSASASVTGTGTVFPTNCVGSIIRFSSSSAMPTGATGGISGTDNLFAFQGVIKTRTSATALVLEEVAPVTIAAGSSYVISDPLDIATGPMLTALLHMARYEFSQYSAREDAGRIYAIYRQSLLEAMAADAMFSKSGPSIPYNPYTRTTAEE